MEEVLNYCIYSDFKKAIPPKTLFPPSAKSNKMDLKGDEVIFHRDGLEGRYLVENDTVYKRYEGASFSRDRTKMILYILCCALHSGCNSVGIIFPGNYGVKQSLKGWTNKRREIFSSLWRSAQKQMEFLHPPPNIKEEYGKITEHIGHTVDVRSTNGRGPFQIFLPQNDTPKLNKGIFVHSPIWYTPYTSEVLINQLVRSREAGAEGVVVHCVKRRERLEDMREVMTRCLEYASPECPLLIETSAGQRNEQLSSPRDLLEFYLSIGEKERLALCFDTCHVFSAGYDLMESLHLLTPHVKLIHFNDSKKPFGSRVDRHAPPGKGFIGIERLLEIAKYAVERDIPMVRE